MLFELRHENVVSIHHLIKFAGKFYMGLELLEGGNLSEYLKERYRKKDRLTDKESSDLLRGILEGIAYVHEKGITHRDLKPGNILIKDRNNLQTVKLIDFGLGLMKRRADVTCGT